MDEEQGLASPLAGGISAVRRTVSSSVFGGRQAPIQAQPDPQTTNLLQQNSLALNNVSAQLTNISQHNIRGDIFLYYFFRTLISNLKQ